MRNVKFIFDKIKYFENHFKIADINLNSNYKAIISKINFKEEILEK